MNKQQESGVFFNCPSKEKCMFQHICDATDKQSDELLRPTLVTLNKAEMLWTRSNAAQRIHIIKSGVFVALAHASDGDELPFSLYGRGIAIGLTELYLTNKINGSYHIRCLFPGEICSLSAEGIRKKLEMAPHPFAEQVLSRAFLNQAIPAYMQTMILAKKTLSERILSLLLCLRHLCPAEESGSCTFNITQQEIALLVGSERASIAKKLKRMAAEGLIELGYSSLTLNMERLAHDRVGILAQADSIIFDEVLPQYTGFDHQDYHLHENDSYLVL